MENETKSKYLCTPNEMIFLEEGEQEQQEKKQNTISW